MSTGVALVSICVRFPDRRRGKWVTPAVKSPLTAGMLLALYGIPPVASAAEPAKAQGLEEITVTASRRQQTAEEIPYALSVVTPQSIAVNSVTDLATLTRQIGVSGLGGARSAGITFPIIRGLNASPPTGSFRTIEQTPVGMYLDNSPLEGYFQLQDIQRVEVLRGPQGTLYGAGALGGALRVIPNAPELGKFSGNFDGRVGFVDHAGDPSYTATAMINIPMGETLALRVAGNYEYQPGYIDAYGLMKRSGPLGIPDLADPSDPMNSSGVYYSEQDWNDQKTFTGRASLLWKPTDNFSAQLAFTHGKADGNANTIVNSLFEGGPSVIDPNVILPPGGRLKTFSSIELPYTRKTQLTSLDLSYDAGFATLSSTSTYATNEGSFVNSSNYGLMRPELIPYVPFYAGLPINPRWISVNLTEDASHNFTQEVRLVSDAGPDKKFDYVIGLFYQNQTRDGYFANSNPGSVERAIAMGCTLPVLLGGCLPLVGPGDVASSHSDRQDFEDKSVFGELTYHFAENWQITGGIRYTRQDFTSAASDALFSFGIPDDPTSQHLTVSKTLGKASLAWEYVPDHRAYVLWSQGFRRGGTNALLSSGPFASIAPTSYRPDTVDNYELGFKGRFGEQVSYTFDVFYIRWKDPQVSGLTPTSNFAVWNAKEAVSKGLEFDLNTPLWTPNLRLAMSGTYADSKLTEDYFYPDLLGDIVGHSGEQLPGAPKITAAATVLYGRQLGSGYHLGASLNDTYTTKVVTSTFAVLGQRPIAVPAINMMNASISLSRGGWSYGLYATNLLNKYKILGRSAPIPPLAYVESINRPREIYFRAGYSF